MFTEKKYNEKIGFLLGEKYRLELHWDKVSYRKGTCHIIGSYFSGPALQFAEEIQPNNFILLDMYRQYFIFAATAYLVNLSWGDVKYDPINTRIHLSNVTLKQDTEINKVPKIRNSDYLVINTTGHDAETHMLRPTYDGILVNRDGEAYNFWKVEGSFRKV